MCILYLCCALNLILIQRLRHNYSMDEEGQIRTRESFQQQGYSSESQTYYYSKFQLFQDVDEINQFYLYSLFLEKVSDQLGYEWKQQANSLSPTHFNSRQIFMNLLSIWLYLHPVVNRVKLNNQVRPVPPVFNQSYTDQFIKRLKNLYLEKKKVQDSLQLVINSTSVKAICMGFFITANEIWEQMFQSEHKKQQKSSWVFNSVSNTITHTFKPLMVVTQKLSHFFGRKRIKTEQNSGNDKPDDHTFGDCYMEFRRTIDLEKQIQRKMSDFCLDDQEEKKDCEGEKQQKKVVTKNQFDQNEAPLENNMLGNLYNYVTKFLQKKSSWQVASSFVTNILDLKPQQSLQDGAKVKVLRPAEDFYEKLIISWIMLIQSNQKQDICYDKYIQNVKIAFGRAWKSKYIIPTRYFYQKLTKNWSEIQKQVLHMQISKKQIMSILIKKIRESMKYDWQRKIKMQKSGDKKSGDKRSEKRAKLMEEE